MPKKNTNKTKVINEKQGAVEKPVSLWGAPLADVLAALLKTKPMLKEENKADKKFTKQ